MQTTPMRPAVASLVAAEATQLSKLQARINELQLIGSDGPPAVIGVDFMDDFFLHGPTYDKTDRATTLFMDYTVEVGLLCNPVKVVQPCQQVKYTGFIFDTTGVPRLLVPPAKRSRHFTTSSAATQMAAHLEPLVSPSL